jgi:hypothetical protein
MLSRYVVFIKSRLSDKQKQFVARCLKTMFTVFPHNKNLNWLGLEYGTDKWSHGYLRHYERYFADRRKKRFNILEIGVGGYEDAKSGGSSLRMWQKYFPNAIIHAIDIYDKSPLQTNRIRIYRGSQNDPQFLTQLAAKIGPFHVIIDDGSHINEHVRTSFQTLFPFLAKDGIYVIEDVGTSYNALYGGTAEDLNTAITTMGMLKQFLDGLNNKCISGRLAGRFDEDISAIHFYPNIVFIFKGGNVRPQ